MPLATVSHDVELDGKGYILLAESYRKRGQQPFNPRFSSGDPSLTDLSFWQFMKQEAWDKGAGQLDFNDLSKIQYSSGWSFLDHYPRLAGGNASLSISPTLMADVEYIAGTSCEVPVIHQFLNFGQTTAGRKCVCLIGPGYAGPFKADGTKTTQRAPAQDVTGIYQILAGAGAVWYRQDPDSAGCDGFLCIAD